MLISTKFFNFEIVEKVHLFYRKEFIGSLLTLVSLALTVVALVSYIHNPKLDAGSMAILIAPIGGGGLLFFGIRTTEGYFTNALTTQPPNSTSTTTMTTSNQDIK